MSDSDQDAPFFQYEAPTHTANDFTRIGWTRLDCICADARAAGKAVQFDPHGTGFVQCEDEVGL